MKVDVVIRIAEGRDWDGRVGVGESDSRSVSVLFVLTVEILCDE